MNLHAFCGWLVYLPMRCSCPQHLVNTSALRREAAAVQGSWRKWALGQAALLAHLSASLQCGRHCLGHLQGVRHAKLTKKPRSVKRHQRRVRIGDG